MRHMPKTVMLLTPTRGQEDAACRQEELEDPWMEKREYKTIVHLMCVRHFDIFYPIMFNFLNYITGCGLLN